MFLLLTSLFSCFDRSLTQGRVLDPLPEDLLGTDLFSMQANEAMYYSRQRESCEYYRNLSQQCVSYIYIYYH